MITNTASRRRFKSPYWDVPPSGFEHVTPKEYKAMQAAGQVPHSVVNPSSQHLQGTRFAHGANPSSPIHNSSSKPNRQDDDDRHHRHKSSDDRQSSHHRSSRDTNNGSHESDSNLDKKYNGSSRGDHRSGGRHPDPMAAVRLAAANIEAALAAAGHGIPGKGVAGSKLAATSSTRQARRLYVGNIPFGCTDDDMIEFFQTNMTICGFIKEPGNPVLACQINSDKNFAFIEFRTVEETSSAMALDGILCKGQPLKIRRPHDYQPIAGSEPTPVPIGATISNLLASGNADPAAIAAVAAAATKPSASDHIPGHVSSIVADSPNKIYIGGLPTSIKDDQIKEILVQFGQLRAFNLIKDPTTLASKGYAFCEFLEPEITEQAIIGLNLIDIGGKKLVAQRASVGSKSGTAGAASEPNPNAPVQIQVPGLPSITPSSTPRVLTEVLCLMNMVEPQELEDDEEYAEIVEDIREECSKYGLVRSIEIPRPVGERTVPGLGKVFVEFDSATEAQRAQLNLAGRRFANRVVVTMYFDRDRYKNKEF